MTTRLVVLGAGFGGLEIATLVSEACADSIEIVLIDQSPDFVFGFSKLDVMFGRVPAAHVRHAYSSIVKPSVQFVSASVTAIDPHERRVQTSAGEFAADILVVALGANLDIAATPGLAEVGHEFYTVAGAFELRDVLADFTGGKVVIGVTSTPFKCPPAPSETALLLHEYLSARGLREAADITLVMPFGAPIPPSPQASEAILQAFADRGINWVPDRIVLGLNGHSHTVELSNDEELPFDLFLGVPVHKVPDVVAESGMTVDGWIPVDPLTLETAFSNVYAVGDVTSVGTPKAGVFSEGQAVVVAERIIATINGNAPTTEYGGRGICYLEFGAHEVAKVDVVFRTGERPMGDLVGPSLALMDDKVSFGSERIKRWFGRQWSPLG